MDEIQKIAKEHHLYVIEDALNKSALYHPETLKSYSWSDEYIEKIKCYKESFPVAEKAASSEGIIFHHSYLMGNDDDLQCIISAFKKVQKYAEEL